MTKASQEVHVILNRPALWEATTDESIGVRVYKSNRSFTRKASNAVEYPSSTMSITRYVKSYKRDDLAFSLFIFSDESEPELVDNFLNNVTDALSDEEIRNAIVAASSDDFEYLDRYYGDNE